MKRRTFAVFFLLSLVPQAIAGSVRAQPFTQPSVTSTPAVPQLSANQIVTNIEQVYGQMSSFKATFKQRYVVRAYGKTKDSAGSVIFEKPGKMSWAYTGGNRVVSDGKVITIYTRNTQQLFQWPLNRTQYPVALSFLTGLGNLSQSFTFTLLSSTQMKFPSGYVLRAQPVQATPAYSDVYFYVDATTFQVRRVLILDVQGNRNRFDFQNPLVNAKPPQGAFVFTPPPGTQVIQPSGTHVVPASGAQAPRP